MSYGLHFVRSSANITLGIMQNFKLEQEEERAPHRRPAIEHVHRDGYCAGIGHGKLVGTARNAVHSPTAMMHRCEMMMDQQYVYGSPRRRCVALFFFDSSLPFFLSINAQAGVTAGIASISMRTVVLAK